MNERHDPCRSSKTEEIPAGTEVALAAGDAAFFPANAGGELRNAGTEQGGVLVFLVGPPEEGAQGAPAAGEGLPAAPPAA